MMKIIVGIICLLVTITLYCCLVVGKRSDILSDNMLEIAKNDKEDHRKEN